MMPPLSKKSRWIPLTLISSAAFINYLDRANLSVSLPFVGRDLHLDPFQQGWALAAFSITYTLSQLPVGMLVDRLRLKWLFAGAFALWCLASAATGLACGLITLVFFRLLLGIGESVYLPGGLKFISGQFGASERATPSVVFDIGCKAGLAAGLVLDVRILHRFGWRWLFLSTGLMGLLWLLPWLTLYPPPRQDAAATVPSPSRQSLARMLRSRTAWAMAFGYFCWNYFWYLLVSWVPDWLYTARHVPLSSLGWVAGLLFGIVAMSELLGARFIGATLRRGWSLARSLRVVVTAGFLLGLLIVPAVLSPGPIPSLVFLYGAALSGFLISAILVIPQQFAPHGEVGVWVGFQNFVGNFAGIIGPVATGWLVRRTGSFIPAFGISGMVCFGGIACYLWWMQISNIGSDRNDFSVVPTLNANARPAPRFKGNVQGEDE